MNSKYNILTLVIVLLLLANCKEGTTTQITNSNDYNAYLNISKNETLERAKKNEMFWSQKLEQTPNQYPYKGKLATTYSNYFSATGQVEYLKKAEDYLRELNDNTKYNNASYLKSLAYNYISQHKFKDALLHLTKAELIAEDLQETRKMLFDVHLELGNYEMAHTYLNTFENFSDFDYLIRLSKWSDHKGDLVAAIKYMEKALTIAETSNLAPLKQWSYTNIADFYGHAGNIQKSYDHYLKALALDPNDAYAKKGIAWIVYSYEDNPQEALRILDAVTDSYFAPDYFLLKAEIAEYLGNEILKKEQLALYDNAMQNESYGDMYNKYNVLLHVEANTTIEKAISIAKTEVRNRPTPQSYDLLAWAHFNNGNLEEALHIVDHHIINKTFEPETLYHVAEIYKAAGNYEDVTPLKEELLASTFELGPLMKAKILNL